MLAQSSLKTTSKEAAQRLIVSRMSTRIMDMTNVLEWNSSCFKRRLNHTPKFF